MAGVFPLQAEYKCHWFIHCSFSLSLHLPTFYLSLHTQLPFQSNPPISPGTEVFADLERGRESLRLITPCLTSSKKVGTSICYNCKPTPSEPRSVSSLCTELHWFLSLVIIRFFFLIKFLSLVESCDSSACFMQLYVIIWLFSEMGRHLLPEFWLEAVT